MIVCEGDRIVVIGVSSFQWNPAGPRCQKETTVGAYVEVQAHLTWIREKIGEGNKKLEYLFKESHKEDLLQYDRLELE